MDDLGSISPKDKSIIQDLVQQEQLGEDGFIKYYKGDPAGAQEVKDALRASATNVRSLHNSSLRHQAQDLLAGLNKAIAAYMRNPSDDNLGVLKSGIDHYKDFLNQF